MDRSTNFFTSNPSNNFAYKNVRDNPRLESVRSFVEALWREYRPLADSHFLNEAKEHFHQRFWEMYVAVTLQRKGLNLIKVSDEGPEFYFMHENKRVWVEAVAPEAGDGADAVPELQYGGEVAYDVPVEGIILRYTNALDAKLEQYEKNLRKNIIQADDHYIIALNCRQIPPHVAYRKTETLPYGIQACLPFGKLQVSVDRNTGGVVDSHYEYRNQIIKKNKASVETTAFLDAKYEGITGLLHSAVDPVNRPTNMGGDFWFLHNPSARLLFGKSPFQFCKQYFFENQTLKIVDPNEPI